MDGMAQVQGRLNLAVAAMAGPAATKTVQMVAEDLVTGMKAAAPVLTGELQRSIGAVDAGHAAMDIVVGAAHGDDVEFGTSDTPAQPFMRPTLHQGEQSLPRTARVVYRSTVPYLD